MLFQRSIICRPFSLVETTDSKTFETFGPCLWAAGNHIEGDLRYVRADE